MRGRESAMERAEARPVLHWARRSPRGCPSSLHTRWSRNARPRAVAPEGFVVCMTPGVRPLLLLAVPVATAVQCSG